MEIVGYFVGLFFLIGGSASLSSIEAGQELPHMTTNRAAAYIVIGMIVMAFLIFR